MQTGLKGNHRHDILKKIRPTHHVEPRAGRQPQYTRGYVLRSLPNQVAGLQPLLMRVV